MSLHRIAYKDVFMSMTMEEFIAILTKAFDEIEEGNEDGLDELTNPTR